MLEPRSSPTANLAAALAQAAGHSPAPDQASPAEQQKHDVDTLGRDSRRGRSGNSSSSSASFDGWTVDRQNRDESATATSSHSALDKLHERVRATGQSAADHGLPCSGALQVLSTSVMRCQAPACSLCVCAMQ